MRLIFPRYGWVVGIVFFIIAIPIAGFLLSKNNPKTPINFTPVRKPVDPCIQFSADLGEIDLGEISCEEAKAIAINKYPGQVLSVEKTTLPYQLERSPKGKTEDRKVWLVHIKPADMSFLPTLPENPNSKEVQTSETIGVAVDRKTKEILFFQTYFNQ